MTDPIEPVKFARNLILELAAGTLLEDVPVDAYRLEAEGEPPRIVLKEGGDVHERGVGMLNPARIRATCYGTDPRQASRMYRALVAILHRAGPLVRDGVGLFKAFDETGPQPLTDPDTRWDAVFGVFDLHLADRPVA